MDLVNQNNDRIFYENLNQEWKEFIKKERLRTTFQCTNVQRDFLLHATIISLEAFDELDEFYLNVTFLYQDKKIEFKRSFEPRDNMDYWFGNEIFSGGYYAEPEDEFFDRLISMFPFYEKALEFKEKINK